MQALWRHQLVWLDEYAWHRVLAQASSTAPGLPAPSPQVQDCLAHWAQQAWPLVVTRQSAESAVRAPDGVLALGLAAPARWGRQPISVAASWPDVARQGAFPPAADIGPDLPAAARAGWQRLCQGLARLGLPARVFGSYGWQRLTGMNYVHAASDVDLLIEAGTAAQADQAAALLRAAEAGPVRVDGELAFADGAAVAWREWLRFRAGQTDRILVKRLTGATLEDAGAWALTA